VNLASRSSSLCAKDGSNEGGGGGGAAPEEGGGTGGGGELLLLLLLLLSPFRPGIILPNLSLRRRLGAREG
jgi:hypothetical protein